MQQAILSEDKGIQRLESAEALLALQQELREARDPDQLEIVVCYGTGCLASGATKVEQALKETLAQAEMDVKVRPLIKTTGCRGFCSRGPLVVIQPEGIFYQKVSPQDAEDIVASLAPDAEPVDRLLYRDPKTDEVIPHEEDIPFYKLQQRLVMNRIGSVDPTNIFDSIEAGAYQALAKALSTMTPEDVVAEVEKSGIRGRGGAGFPTGRKWRSAIKAAIEKKGRPVYVVVNGDEGDPGAFMDCTALMEGDPASAVLEGLILGAYALGAEQGYMYVRMEYPVRRIKHLNIAMDAGPRNWVYLGENILGSGF
jgi:NADP-reducing hydrogenase subunit HndC